VSWSRVSALVCTRCDDDLVYVELAKGGFDGRLHLDRWATDWLGCRCVNRARLTFADTFEIVETGGGHDVRVERWGDAR
jgi:hypothetical protein